MTVVLSPRFRHYGFAVRPTVPLLYHDTLLSIDCYQSSVLSAFPSALSVSPDLNHNILSDPNRP